MRILVVESDLPSARKTRTLLEGGGHVIHVAANAAEAVSRLNTIFFDLVLMGIGSPGTDGLETARAIREADDLSASIPIIALGAANEPMSDDHCLKAGVNAFLPRPLSLPAFAETLRQVHNRRVFGQKP